MSLTTPQLVTLARASRRAAGLSALGATIVVIALGLGSRELLSRNAALEAQLGAKRTLGALLDTQQRALTVTLGELGQARAQAERELAAVTAQLAAARQQAQAAQDTASDLAEVVEGAGRVVAKPAAPATPVPTSAREQARAEWRAGQAARLRKDPAAAKHFQAAIAADPSYAPPYNSLGRIYAENGNLKAAELYYRSSLSRDPGYRAALANLASATERTDGPAAALPHAQALLQLRPGDARAVALVERLAAASR